MAEQVNFIDFTRGRERLADRALPGDVLLFPSQIPAVQESEARDALAPEETAALGGLTIRKSQEKLAAEYAETADLAMTLISGGLVARVHERRQVQNRFEVVPTTQPEIPNLGFLDLYDQIPNEPDNYLDTLAAA